MASSHSSSFKCSICLDGFTDPVSTPCGHNFCKVCINTYWDSTNVTQCPLCQHNYQKRPKLRVNVMFRDLIELKQTNIQNVPEERAQTQDILCDVCPGEKTVKAVKSCLYCEESLCSEHLKPHQDDVDLKTHELLDPVSRLKDRVCKQHKRPLELVCHRDLTCVCVLCIKSNNQNHQCVPLKNRLRKRKAKVDEELAEVQQEIMERKKMVEKLEESGEISEKNVGTDMEDVVRIFNHFQQLVKINKSGLVTALNLLHKKAEHRRETMTEKLKEEMSDLEERQNELEQLSQMDDLRLLQSLHSLSDPPKTEDWSEISVYSDSAVGTVRSAVTKLLRELCNQSTSEGKGLIAKEISRIQRYAVDVTLDSNTANRVLVVSKDGKQVKYGGVPQNLPEIPERFEPLLGVLGKEGYSSGAFYFEVQVEGKSAWDIGVALETVDRKHQTDVRLSNGFVVLMLRNETKIIACDRPPVEINLPKTPEKVGVFVDHEEGEVCFYDIGSKAHIYSFTCCRFPKKKLHPYLNPCTEREGNNSAPMVITPVR
ncbi:E3 ubiquitin-protein ligase TRIM39-like [Seriola aureovittata]|uniref:E3 ubiquitin-protein ligase TRIM39-like n=2 Tax=Seriola TaxID=8160 RepID=UPI0024BED635|nr:E3 ubiquitin-protein ligase TRIM39-like [Seriola aureovittata]XP_056225631.1 E3 ubiquitin-protein ligase TRIM39-like [Seriola aureovittata]XP_056225632.1 E3 ubiquitin-protein ligase TRIM39-like [Seriola aureovittata]